VSNVEGLVLVVAVFALATLVMALLAGVIYDALRRRRRR
jgi:hypothetical protein